MHRIGLIGLKGSTRRFGTVKFESFAEAANVSRSSINFYAFSRYSVGTSVVSQNEMKLNYNTKEN